MKQPRKFPIVLKNNKGEMVLFIYEEHIELYGVIPNGVFTQTKAEIEADPKNAHIKWTPEIEIDIAKNNGFVEVYE